MQTEDEIRKVEEGLKFLEGAQILLAADEARKEGAIENASLFGKSRWDRIKVIESTASSNPQIIDANTIDAYLFGREGSQHPLYTVRTKYVDAILREPIARSDSNKKSEVDASPEEIKRFERGMKFLRRIQKALGVAESRKEEAVESVKGFGNRYQDRIRVLEAALILDPFTVGRNSVDAYLFSGPDTQHTLYTTRKRFVEGFFP